METDCTLINCKPLEVLQTSFLLEVTLFWDAALCSLVEVCQCFRGTYNLATLPLEAVNSPETSSRLRVAISQKTVDFILTTVRT